MSGMQMDEGDARLLEPVSERIIGCAFRVARPLCLMINFGRSKVEIRRITAQA